MFCEEIIGKIKFRAFPNRVGPRILSLESVDYFGTSEHYVEKKIVFLCINLKIVKSTLFKIVCNVSVMLSSSGYKTQYH